MDSNTTLIYTLTNKQARQFMLAKHGLMGKHKFVGKQGIMDFVNQAGCVQFDPIDVCGKNYELVFQSRVKGFTKSMLYELLYVDRVLVDYFDKQLSIFAVEDWKYFGHIRESYRTYNRSLDIIDKSAEYVKQQIKQRGALSSSALDLNEKVSWSWSNQTNLSRAVLEALYFRGELAIHHKVGTIKHYDLVENCIDKDILSEPFPFENDEQKYRWWVYRRICSVGLLPNKASDAWLNIGGLKASQRNTAFEQLMSDKKLLQVDVEGTYYPLYCSVDDKSLIDQVMSGDFDNVARCELIAPLDNFMWDRKLIAELFKFDYKWEIYTPEKDRKYGYYTLPLLYGDRFIGRVEAVSQLQKQGQKKSNQRVLEVKNIWYEDGVKVTKQLEKALDSCLKRFAIFNECSEIIML